MHKVETVRWTSTVLSQDNIVKTTRQMTCDTHYAGCLLTQAAHMIHGMHQMREFVDDLINAIVDGGSMREIDYENAKLMELLESYDRFQENTRDLTEHILGCPYGEETEESEE
jgi:hypothetical protein